MRNEHSWNPQNVMPGIRYFPVKMLGIGVPIANKNWVCAGIGDAQAVIAFFRGILPEPMVMSGKSSRMNRSYADNDWSEGIL
jgi:hypothetical protein